MEKIRTPTHLPAQADAAPLPDWVTRRSDAGGPTPTVATSTQPELLGATAARDIFTVAEAAAYLKVSVRTVRRQISSGSLKAFSIGRSVRITGAELNRFVGLTNDLEA